MARIPMVTRTVKSTVVDTLLYNKESKETENKILEVSRTYKTDEELEKKIADYLKLYLPNYRLVCINSSNVKLTPRAMTEDVFISYSSVIKKENPETDCES